MTQDGPIRIGIGGPVGSGKTFKITGELVQGIDSEHAKKIAKKIRDFLPEQIELPADRRVRITVTNAGRLTHTLHIDELGIGGSSVEPASVVEECAVDGRTDPSASHATIMP